MTPYETIRLTAAALSDGESVRGTCPWCMGGGTGEQSFIITRRRNDAMYVCHRASCNHRSSGCLNIRGTAVPIRQQSAQKSGPRGRVYDQQTFTLGRDNRKYLYDRCEFTDSITTEYRLREDVGGKLVIPLYNSNGVQQGFEVKRTQPVHTGPKSLLYWGDNADGMGWFTGKPSYSVSCVEEFSTNTLIIVEDVLSAMKANAICNTVSLMGTHMSPDQAQRIASGKYETVYMALDADATARAANIVRRYRAIIPNLRILVLTKDIKDMSYVEVVRLILGDSK